LPRSSARWTTTPVWCRSFSFDPATRVPTTGVVVLPVERQLVTRLPREHAMVPERAIRFDNLRWVQSRRLARLAHVGAVHATAGGRWYLDEPVYAEFVAHRRRVVLIVAAAAVLTAIGVSILNG
jgi:hypothetical protein